MNLPTRKEWEAAGFTVPDELCSNAEHLEALRAAVQIAERHESEMRAKLGETADRYACGSRTQAELTEMAECYVAVKRACQNAQERYREAIRTNWSYDPQSDTSSSCP